jgi:hypothetical protein
MKRDLVAHNRPTFDQLHPVVPEIAAGLVAWFVLMPWVFFDRQSVVGLPLAFITVFFVVVGLCLGASFLVYKRHRPDHARHPNEISFRDWSMANFSVWGGKQSGGQAAVEILLPIAAAAVGITAIGTVFLIISGAVS